MAFADTGVLDDFNRANEGPPMTGWGDLVSGLVVSSNACAPSAAGNRSSYYNTILTAADCEVFATIASNPASNRNMSLYARLTDIGSGTTDGYGIRFNKSTGTDTLQIVRMDNGSISVLGADFSQELVAGNKFGLEIVGDTLTAYVDTGSGWTSLGSRTDTTYASAGYLGADIGSGTLDDFGGGELAAGGTPIGLNSETDTPLALTADKSRTAGLPAETDALLSLVAEKSKTAGLVTETDSPLGLTAAKAKTTGLGSEADTPLPVTGAKSKTTGLQAETDTSLALTAQKAKTTGLNSETDTPLALARVKSKTLGLITETDTPLPLTAGGATEIGIAAETDVPLGLTRVKSKAIGIVAETAVPLALTAQKSRAIGLATETDTPLTITRHKTAFIGFANETSTALPFVVAGGDSVVRYVTIDGEFETAVSLEGEYETAVILAGEFETAVTLAGEL